MKRLLTVWFLVLVAMIINLTGCGKNGGAGAAAAANGPCAPSTGSFADAPMIVPSLTGITKLGVFGECIAESETVVFKDQVILVGNIAGFVTLYDFNTKTIISQTRNLSALFNSALVVNDRLYVLSTESPKIKMSYTDDLQTWSDWEYIFDYTQVDSAADIQVFNTSMIYTEQDGFVLAYEVGGAPGTNGYSWRIATSSDLQSWTAVGTRFSNEYSACPVIRYVNGYYQFIYLMGYMNGPAGMVSVVARTQDFITYEKSNTVFLAASSGEGINASDVSLNELNGQVYINYMDGNQGGWDDQMTATYNGTMSDMFHQIWND